MPRLVLKNVSRTDISVPSPNGGGRKIPHGKCVEGTYFYRFTKVPGFKIVPEDQIVNEDVIFFYDVPHIGVRPFVHPDSVAVAAPVEAPVPVVEPTVEVVPELAPEVPVDTVPVVSEDISTRELQKLSAEELKTVASELGITFDETVTRKRLISLIKSAKFAK